MKTFDLVIIGGGAGAFASAISANELGINVVMINTGLPLGGTCVNVGCVPSKILLHAGEVLHMAKNHNIGGVELEVKNFDFQQIILDELAMVKESREDKYEKVLKNLEHVTFIDGMASFVSQDEVEVNGEKIKGKKFIIATGSKANVPPIEGIKDVGYITHIEALQLKEQPKELVIVGAGPIGLEFAQVYSRFGTKVTILQKGNSIFSHGEKELMDKLTDILKNEGISIQTNVNIQSVKKENGKKVLSYDVDSTTKEIIADEILLAVGKTPNTKNLNLDIVGIKINKRQAIIVDKYLQTTNKNIFAVGDVTNAPLRLETTAGREGTIAPRNAFAGKKEYISYNTVPFTIFTSPQYASVGLTEDMQMERFGICSCRTISFDIVPKAQIIRQTEGMIKMGIDPKTKQIVGVHILGPNAGDLITQAMVLIKNKNTIDDVIHSTPVFPTLSEAIKIVALSFTKDISKLSCCV